ncbi:hypothetical protein [Paenibacillus gorillae]|uniref:hypothetical protein n=1 Tax=Paenibacillus gorillae TaxID=1243662 RepID=UPI0004B2B058|nr:hypothetical protein [Paenibacillus gorillae]
MLNYETDYIETEVLRTNSGSLLPAHGSEVAYSRLRLSLQSLYLRTERQSLKSVRRNSNAI